MKFSTTIPPFIDPEPNRLPPVWLRRHLLNTEPQGSWIIFLRLESGPIKMIVSEDPLVTVSDMSRQDKPNWIFLIPGGDEMWEEFRGWLFKLEIEEGWYYPSDRLLRIVNQFGMSYRTWKTLHDHLLKVYRNIEQEEKKKSSTVSKKPKYKGAPIGVANE